MDVVSLGGGGGGRGVGGSPSHWASASRVGLGKRADFGGGGGGYKRDMRDLNLTN